LKYSIVFWSPSRNWTRGCQLSNFCARPISGHRCRGSSSGNGRCTGQVHALVKDRHRSCEFIEFLKLTDAAYPTHTAIKLILDNGRPPRDCSNCNDVPSIS
jgi:hypothetical protein